MRMRVFMLEPHMRQNKPMAGSLEFHHRFVGHSYRPYVVRVYRMLRQTGCASWVARHLVWQMLAAGQLGEVATRDERTEARQATGS